MKHGNIETSLGYANYYATWEDYDGAPDTPLEFRLIGIGSSRQAAIRDLISETEGINEDDERLDEYRAYLVEKNDALAEDAGKSARKERILKNRNRI